MAFSLGLFDVISNNGSVIFKILAIIFKNHFKKSWLIMPTFEKPALLVFCSGNQT